MGFRRIRAGLAAESKTVGSVTLERFPHFCTRLAKYEKDQKEAGRDLNKKAGELSRQWSVSWAELSSGMQYEQSKVAAQKLIADKETTLAEKREIEVTDNSILRGLVQDGVFVSASEIV